MSHIVIDFGRAYIRAGVAGEPQPRTVIPVSDGDARILRKAEGEELVLRVLEIFSQLFPFVTARRAKETRVLLLENPTERRALRNAIAEVLFRYFKIDLLCLYPSLFMSIVPTGLRTGVLVDVGLNETRAVAVFDSRVLLTTLTTAPVGWSTLLARSTTDDSAQQQAVAQSENEHDRALRMAEHSLLARDAEHPEELQELLGSGVWATDEFRGVAGVLLDCLLKCPVDVSRAVVTHVVFSGGVSSVAGFTHEVAKVAVHNATTLPRYSSLRPLLQHQEAVSGQPALKPEVVCFPAHILAWVGGSLLACCKGLGSRYVRETDVQHAADASVDMPDWMSNHPEDWRFLAPTL